MIEKDILNHFGIDESYFDFNFTFEYPQKEDQEKYMRGGREYLRPCGWYRFGLKIKGKYDNGNDKWMGNNNSEGEWVNTYHGTKIKNVKNIIAGGLKPGSRNLYGVGIYCSPNVERATVYAKSFEYEEEAYQVINSSKNVKKMVVK